MLLPARLLLNKYSEDYAVKKLESSLSIPLKMISGASLHWSIPSISLDCTSAPSLEGRCQPYKELHLFIIKPDSTARRMIAIKEVRGVCIPDDENVRLIHTTLYM